jgi:PilZ domain
MKKAPPKPDDSATTVRRSSRVYFQVRAQAVIYPVFPTEKPRRASVLTCDLSSSGVQIRHTSPLTRGQQLDLLIGERQRRAEVVWCRRHKDAYTIGCRFVK